MDNVHISYSQGSGLVALNCFESIILKNSKFDQNCKVVEGKGDKECGNVFLDIEKETKVEVLDSHFSNCYGGGGYSGGLNIDIHVYQTLNVSVYITSSTFSNNSGTRDGGNMRIKTESRGNTTLLFCIQIHNSSFSDGYAERGGGLYADLDSASSSLYKVEEQCISSTSFKSNIGGGLYINRLSLNLLNVSFLENNAKGSGGGVQVGYERPFSFKTITFTNTSFIGNRALEGGGVYVGTSYAVFFLGSTFSGNVAVQFDGGGVSIYCKSMNIIRCYFENNEAKTNGGAILMYWFDLSTLTILDSQFEANSAEEEGGHIFIHIQTVDKPGCMTVHLDGCILEGGGAKRGGAISIPSMMDFTDHITNIKLILSNCTLTRNYAISGGIVDINLSNLKTWEVVNIIVSIKSTDITENQGTILNIVIVEWVHIDLIDSNIAYNRADSGSIVQVDVRKHHAKTSMTVAHTQFFGNTFSQLRYNSAVIQLNNVNIIVTAGTTFINNMGSSIAAKSSLIAFHGRVKFMNNMAYVGVALHLDCSDDTNQPSFLLFFPNTTVTITNNTALYYGGGVAVNPVCNYYSSCFFQSSAQQNSTMYCQDNTALVAGSCLYGPSVYPCSMEHDMRRAFAILFKIDGGYSVDQVVLAPANSVCFCEDKSKYSCSTELQVSVFPGTEFTVSALSTGMLNNISSSVIRATFTEIGGLGGKFSKGRLQDIQDVQRSCSQLMYSVISTNEAQIKLQIDSVENAPPSYVNITILECPLGFKFPDEGTEMCNCNDYLINVPDIVISCLINNNTGEITVSGKSWIGMYSGKLAVHRFCPLDYCISEVHSVDLQQQHLQCTNNRSGVLCGACQTGLSLGLGTARCLDNCSNYYLFLVIPFTLAGLAVTLMLLKCNITVAMGIINPLILYANIVHINATFFFPQHKELILTNFLEVFIAWLNLDFGIETCFYRGMTAYGHTWLQFVFPVYIWLLVVLLIYTSRYSVTASKMIGRNAVSVLATLFLLSYAKLLRTVISAVASISLEDEDRKSHLLWRMDANVPYLSPPHAVLFSTALLAVLLYILPLTLLTLLAPLLQARTNHRMMRWVVRIKPLLDAYQGPYKDKYRNWTGVTLLLRIILFTAFAANTHGNTNINLFILAIVAPLFQLYSGRLHKHWLNGILVRFYIGNLAIFSTAALFLNTSQGNTEALACIMVGSAFVVSCFIVLWHFNHQTRAINTVVRKLRSVWKSQKPTLLRESRSPDPPPPLRQSQPTISVIDMRELREPLLTDS